MRIITRQTVADTAAERWASQYRHDKSMRVTTLRRINALGKHPNPDDVDRVIGNDSWTRTPCCDECGAENVPVLLVGQEPDYESATACLCGDCVRQAFSIMARKVGG